MHKKQTVKRSLSYLILALINMKKLIRLNFALLLGLGINLDSNAATATFRIMETTDIHMNLLGYDYYQDHSVDNYGLQNTINLISMARTDMPNNILIDNGDLLQGGPMGDVAFKYWQTKTQNGKTISNYIHPAYIMMNELNYTAANIGNHDFNYGLNYLKDSIKDANFPYVNSNVVDAHSGRPVFNPYLILERKVVLDDGSEAKLKVGIIGFTPPQILEWDKPLLSGKIKVLDIVTTAKYYIPQMKKMGADIVIAVPHSGLESSYSDKLLNENVVLDLSKLKDIDAILFGHAHGKFPSKQFANYSDVNLKNGSINGVPAVMAGWWGNSLGIIDLHLNYESMHWHVAEAKSELKSLSDIKLLNDDASELNELSPSMKLWHQRTLKYMHEPLMQNMTPIYSYFALVEPAPTDAVIHAAQLSYGRRLLTNSPYRGLPLLSAVAPFKAGGRNGSDYYTDIPAGTLMRKNISDLYVYPNTVAILKITGNDLREWLEMSAGQYLNLTTKSKSTSIINPAFSSFNFDNIAGAGLSYIIDLNQAPRYSPTGKLLEKKSHRIKELRLSGRAITPKEEFAVITNNYRANGGGEFPGINSTKIVIESSTQVREIVLEYIKDQRQMDVHALTNWRLELPSNQQFEFNTGSGAAKYLESHPEFYLLKESQGAKELSLILSKPS